MITHLKFAGIPTRNQDVALAFYTDKLGFKVVTDQPMGEKQRWIELRVGNSDSRVVLFTPDGHGAARSSTARSPATTSKGKR
jgi:catechol 2,3-dioxygenase-like lactoylglutathione lyase family enzyme